MVSAIRPWLPWLMAPGVPAGDVQTRLLGRGSRPIVGFEVVTTAGEPAGTVEAVLDGLLLIRVRSAPFRRWRALPSELAVIRDVDRTVVMLVDRKKLLATPKVQPHERLDATRIRDW